MWQRMESGRNDYEESDIYSKYEKNALHDFTRSLEVFPTIWTLEKQSRE